MSTYAIHKLLKRIRSDPAFRQQLQQDADSALVGFALSAEERTALREGHVGRLHAMGVHGYMLSSLARYGLFGITPEVYVERIRQR